MKVVIELEKMEFRASHGCCETEQRVGSRFRVDVAIEAEIGDAARHDDLAGTVDYAAVCGVVREEMAIPAKIIEHVALRIADRIGRDFPQALGVTVKISKLAPPVPGKIARASVTVAR